MWVGDLSSLTLTAEADCGGPAATVRVYGTVTGASRGTVELDRTLTVAVPVVVPVEMVRGVGATVPFEVATVHLDSDTAGATSATLWARIVGTLAGSSSMTLPGDPGGAACTISVRFSILTQDARSV